RRLHQPIPVVHHGPGRVAAAADPDTGAPPVSALLDQATEEMTAIRPLRAGGRPAAQPAHAPLRPAADAHVSRPRATPLAASGPVRVSAPVAPPPSTTAPARTVTPRSHQQRRWIAVLVALCLLL